MENTQDYNINFFKPRTPFLKENVRIITISVTIWALAVFGFHFLLKIVETPTPEPSYHAYQKVWSNLEQGTATASDKKEIAKVYLTLIGKYIPLRSNDTIKGLFTATVLDILPADKRQAFTDAAAQAATNTDINTESVVTALGLDDDRILSAVIPYAITPLTSETQKLTDPSIPAIMEKHLIHNRSFLTDTQFLGFPFHYFYTGIFLKTLFCLICLGYCKTIDGVMKKYGMESSYE